MALLQNNDLVGDNASAAGVDSLTPLLVGASSFQVNQGQAQRSSIDSVSVRFNQPTNLPDLITDGAVFSAVQIVGAGGPLALTADRYHYDPVTFTLTIDLAGSHLADGRYDLRLDTSLITAAGSRVNHLNLLGMTPATDLLVHYGFSRLEGDFNGDGTVTALDRSLFLGHFGTKSGQGLYDSAFDLNGDGVISLIDYMAWLKQQGKKV